MHDSGQVLGDLKFSLDEGPINHELRGLIRKLFARHASTCRRIGPKFRCMRSTPMERLSFNPKFLVCFAKTGVNAAEMAVISR